MGYEICLFDLDGTLTDSKIGIIKSYRYALSALGIHKELEELDKYIGPPLRDTFKNSLGLSDLDVEKAVEKFREYSTKTGIYENMVYPEIPEVLRRLKDAGKILAVATNKVTSYAELTVKHFELDKYFDFVSGDDMDGSRTKYGKGEIIRSALDALDPNRELTSVMIGDRKHDIIAAQELGIDSIGITWGYGLYSELKEAGATKIIESPRELICLI